MSRMRPFSLVRIVCLPSLSDICKQLFVDNRWTKSTTSCPLTLIIPGIPDIDHQMSGTERETKLSCIFIRIAKESWERGNLWRY